MLLLVVLGYTFLTQLKSEKREFLIIFIFCTFIYMLGTMMGLMADTESGAEFSFLLATLGGTFTTLTFLMFVQKYCERPLPRWANITLLASAIVVVLLAWTMDWHSLIFQYVYMRPAVFFPDFIHWGVARGPLFPLVIAFPTICIVLSLVILLWELRGADLFHRKRLGLLIFCALVPGVSQVINTLYLNVFGIHYTIVLVAVSILLAYFGFFKYYLQESEEAVRAQKLVQNLISNISHDIKTPLTVLGLSLERLLEATPGDPSYSRDIRIAYNKSLDLQRLIKNMIEITRIDAAKDLYQLEWVPLNRILSDIQLKYGDYLESAGLSLDVTGSAQNALIHIDRVMIWSIFDNIIYNAVRHTEAGGITVTAELADKTAIITVTDTGSGIASEHVAHVFDRFYKVETSRAAGDSGLGLFIVKKIMEGLGGQVWLESEVGTGTSVMLMFEKE
ncbi:MAG: ATP-binding protein [Oscillospiraceae bacterium]|nr:ATP-binding protein [Oscillospiraceae bacterium]